ncbi:MAG TPA: type II secretion system protein [Tichowtungia sp.]|nr:type II secretion system protein [Tichowtungia sp.]
MKNHSSSQAMTLLEILIAVSILGLLMALALPAVNKALQRRSNAITASRMRIAVNAFELYRSENGGYPPDVNNGVTPPEMRPYFISLGIITLDDDGNVVGNWWEDDTDVGGEWDWDNGYHYAYSVSLCRPTASQEQLEELDALLEPPNSTDAGNLSTGRFRKYSTQYHYILEE